MYTYELYDTNDRDAFYKICDSLEAFYPQLIKEKEAIDVDGSIVVLYNNNNDKITVINDETWSFIFCKSTFDLTGFIKQLRSSEMENSVLISE